jgi:hypothetical protein
MIGTESGEHLHPEDRERVRHEWEHTGRLGHLFRCEYRYRQPNGTICWVLVRVKAAR